MDKIEWPEMVPKTELLELKSQITCALWYWKANMPPDVGPTELEDYASTLGYFQDLFGEELSDAARQNL
jgi:hypothetical protein